MTLLRRLAWRLGQELARRPEARAKAKEMLTETKRVVNDDLKPRVQQAWRNVIHYLARARTSVLCPAPAPRCD